MSIIHIIDSLFFLGIVIRNSIVGGVGRNNSI